MERSMVGIGRSGAIAEGASDGLRGRIVSLFELGQGRLPAMEGLRGLAILLVFITHFCQLYRPYIGVLDPQSIKLAESFGHAGVDVFFVLSGYLMYGSLMKGRMAILSFYLRRIIRIYPAFLAVFALYVVLSVTLPGRNKIPDGWPGAAYLLQNVLLLPGVFKLPLFIEVAWSLSYEMAFYALLPIVWLGPWRTKTPAFRTVALVGVMVAYLLACAAGTGIRWPGVALEPFNHPRAVHFLNGMLVWELLALARARAWIERANDAVVTLVFAAGLALAALVWAGQLPVKLPGAGRSAILTGALTLMVAKTFLSTGLIREMFSAGPMRWLGNVSYSFYLTHGLVMKLPLMVALSLWPPARQWGWPSVLGMALVCMSLSATVSAVLFVLVEKRWSVTSKARVSPPAPVPAEDLELANLAMQVGFGATAPVAFSEAASEPAPRGNRAHTTN